MSMKKTDLEKNKMLKSMIAMKGSGTPDRFGRASTEVIDRREQRKLDHAAGLIPFACKLPQTMVDQVRSHAEKEGIELNSLVARLIEKGLAAK